MASQGKVPLLDVDGRFPDRFTPQAALDAVTTTTAGAEQVALDRVAVAADRVAVEAVPTTSDALMAGALGTGGEFDTALDATIVAGIKRKNGAPQVASPLLTQTPVTLSNNTFAVNGKNPATGKLYAILANGHYGTSTDGVTWADKVYSNSTYTPGATGWEFDLTYMYVYTTAGKIWRTPIDVFNGWVEVTVADKGPLTTARPGSLCAIGEGILLYGNYTSGAGDGSHIWRSTDFGATWAHVLDISGGKHVHAIRYNVATGNVWATLGDAGFAGIGLWKSTDNGMTWTYMSMNEYGIDMVFLPASGSMPARVVMEGDGLNRPHLVAFPENGEPGDKTFPLVWFTGALADPLCTRATTRGIQVTPNGDVVYFTTTENGAVGSRSGIYVAQGPDLTRAILLLDTTGEEPVAYLGTTIVGNTVFNHLRSFTLPEFGAY